MKSTHDSITFTPGATGAAEYLRIHRIEALASGAIDVADELEAHAIEIELLVVKYNEAMKTLTAIKILLDQAQGQVTDTVTGLGMIR